MELRMQKSDSLVESCIDAPELGRETSVKRSALSSLPLDAEHTLSVGHNVLEVDTVSSEYMERLILLTSKARSWRAVDDQAVDLTEPRLESFRMTSAKFS